MTDKKTKINQNLSKNILTQKDFDFIKWKPEHIKLIPAISIAVMKNNIELIKNIKKEDRTFDNTILAFESSDNAINNDISNINLLEMVSDNKNVREVARAALVEFQNEATEINYDIKLYKAVKDYYDFNYKKEKKNLSKESIKLVEDYIKAFKRMGFDLDTKSRNKLKSIDKKISKLSSEYDSRLAEDNSFILVNEDGMAGVPELVKNSFTKEKNKKGESLYRVGTSYPEYGPFMRYSQSKEKRLELYLKFNNQGGKRNVNILLELVGLRKEKSKLLGYKNHADYVISSRMAKKVEAPYKMLNGLLSKLKSKKDQDLKDLRQEAKVYGIDEVSASDIEYLANKIKESKYNIDQQKIREYFPLDHVLSQMFKIFGDLFGFVLVKSDLKLWHKDVTLYQFKDKQSKKVIGYIALDLFPRDGKFGHACMMPNRSGYLIDENNYNTPFAIIICNFSKPQKKIPSLLTLGEVETIFHEFGHALHHIMTTSVYESQSGTNVLWDFVEAPSQIMEQWLLEESVLKKVSKHYIEGKSLPKSEISKIIESDKFMKGNLYTRQVLQGLLDLDIYTEKQDDPVQHFHRLMKDNLYELPKEVLFVGRFAHIVRGYDAGYYSYLWAERISKDFYSKFKESMNNSLEYKKVGQKYREEILEKGSQREESESSREFLGREVNNNAFVEYLN
ncbi:MAG: thimet oligopeptidase [Patescibacteria group bacterium]|nr:thimet oligopeptidase [Patescibacteria group bacterium]